MIFTNITSFNENITGIINFKNTSTDTCIQVIDSIEASSMHVKKCLVVGYALLGILSISTNAFTVYSIIKTGQYQSRSIRLIMFTNINDIISVFLNNFSTIIYIVFRKQLTCRSRTIMFVLASYSYHMLTSLTCLIALDRFMRIQYLDRHRRILKNGLL